MPESFKSPPMVVKICVSVVCFIFALLCIRTQPYFDNGLINIIDTNSTLATCFAVAPPQPPLSKVVAACVLMSLRACVCMCMSARHHPPSSRTLAQQADDFHTHACFMSENGPCARSRICGMCISMYVQTSEEVKLVNAAHVMYWW